MLRPRVGCSRLRPALVVAAPWPPCGGPHRRSRKPARPRPRRRPPPSVSRPPNSRSSTRTGDKHTLAAVPRQDRRPRVDQPGLPVREAPLRGRHHGVAVEQVRRQGRGVAGDELDRRPTPGRPKKCTASRSSGTRRCSTATAPSASTTAPDHAAHVRDRRHRRRTLLAGASARPAGQEQGAEEPGRRRPRAVVAGKAPAESASEPYGCSVKYK